MAATRAPEVHFGRTTAAVKPSGKTAREKKYNCFQSLTASYYYSHSNHCQRRAGTYCLGLRFIAMQRHSVSQVAVVPVSEWERIKDSLDRRQREKEEQCKARQCREDRRQQSQNIVKHWENTIEVGMTTLPPSLQLC